MPFLFLKRSVDRSLSFATIGAEPQADESRHLTNDSAVASLCVVITVSANADVAQYLLLAIRRRKNDDANHPRLNRYHSAPGH